jgi:GH15 family glucan-1,4-alpha-glucosidase
MSEEQFKEDYAFLYQAQPKQNSTIKADLEYISWHWPDRSFDPWEESFAYAHFFNTIAFREALSLGAQLARRLGDEHAADWYEIHLIEVKFLLEDFWDPKDGYIKSTYMHQGGVEWKTKNLDTAVLIAVMLANSTAKDDPFSIGTSFSFSF